MACSRWSKGVYAASEAAVEQWGRTGRAGQQAVIYAQGSAGVASNYLLDATGKALSDAGFISVCGDLAQATGQASPGGTFGNDIGVARIASLVSFIQGTSAAVRAAAGKVHGLGASGGCTDLINYARANPGNIASLYLIAPFNDILATYNTPARLSSVGLTQASFNKAYNNQVDDGGTAFLAAMPTHDPSAPGNQAVLAPIPIRLVYSTDDPAVTPASVTAYRDLLLAAGVSVSMVSEGAVGHSAAGIDRADMVSFFQAHS